MERHVSRRQFVRSSIAALASAGLCGSSFCKQREKIKNPPNFVILFTDDQGYGDLGCFGSKTVSTPYIDRMAAEGIKLTSFYAAPVCSPSRSALMTGCYPKRVDMDIGSDFGVLLAGDPKGLHPDEITIADLLKKQGYATGIFGKWHLGDQPEFLPTRQGFDEFWGTPYSNDIWPYHHNNERFNFPPLPLMDNETVIESNPDQTQLTKRTTDRAIDFITRHKAKPFFCYVPFNMPHRPIHVSDDMLSNIRPLPKDIRFELYKFVNGLDFLYPACIKEIDHSVGRILTALKELGLDENTLVLFTSDNGPAAGSAGPLRGRKGSTWEGGMRVPCVVRWPGQIPAGRASDRITSVMDILPTVSRLSCSASPKDRIIDGKDLWPILSGEDDREVREVLFYYRNNELRAVRSGPWKLHTSGELYNLGEDIGEKTDVAGQHPDVVLELNEYLDMARRDLGDADSQGKNVRSAGLVEKVTPLIPH